VWLNFKPFKDNDHKNLKYSIFKIPNHIHHVLIVRFSEALGTDTVVFEKFQLSLHFCNTRKQLYQYLKLHES